MDILRWVDDPCIEFHDVVFVAVVWRSQFSRFLTLFLAHEPAFSSGQLCADNENFKIFSSSSILIALNSSYCPESNIKDPLGIRTTEITCCN